MTNIPHNAGDPMKKCEIEPSRSCSVEPQLLTLINELREFRSEFNEFRVEQSKLTATIESDVKTGIRGNGQPSRLAVAEQKIEALNNDKSRMIGITIGVSSVISLIGGFVMWLTHLFK